MSVAEAVSEVLPDLGLWAREGYRVVVLADDVDQARDLLDAHGQRLGSSVARVERASGRLRIRCVSGGEIWYASARSPLVLRGVQADVVCVAGPYVARWRREARWATHASARPGAGLYVSWPDRELERDDGGVEDLVRWMHDELGIQLQPWQRQLLKQVIAGRRDA